MLQHSNRWTMVYIGGHWTLVYSKGKAWKSFLAVCSLASELGNHLFSSNLGIFLVLWNFWWKAPATFSAENSVITLDFLLCSPCGTPMPLLRWEWSAPGAGWTRRGRYLSAQCWKYKSSAFHGIWKHIHRASKFGVSYSGMGYRQRGWIKTCYEALWLDTLTHRQTE